MKLAYDPTRIQALLRYQGRTGAWLAERTGYDESTVSRFLNGKQPMTEKFVTRAADLLGVPAEWFAEPEAVNAA